MLRGKGSIKPVHSNSRDRVGTVAARAGKRQRLPAVLSRWNGAQRGEGHLKSSGITLRCVTASQSSRDPCEVTFLEGVFFVARTDTFVEQAGMCLGWPLGKSSSSWSSENTERRSLSGRLRVTQPFLHQRRTGLMRFPRNAIAWMFELTPVASQIAAVKTAKQMHWFWTPPSHRLVFITSPAGKPYEDAAFQSLTLKTQSVWLCVWFGGCEYWGFFFFLQQAPISTCVRQPGCIAPLPLRWADSTGVQWAPFFPCSLHWTMTVLTLVCMAKKKKSLCSVRKHTDKQTSFPHLFSVWNV